MAADGQAVSDGGFRGHFVGVVQVVGGALEIALGAGGVVVPSGITQVGGVILIGHGADTIVAGFRSIYSGQVQQSFTQIGATAAAKSLGASSQTAQYIGTGADFAAGVGPSVAIGAMRRLAIAGASASSERVAIAYLHRSALEMGHNAVGIRQGGVTAWFHFAGVPTGRVVATNAPGAKYVVTELAVTGTQAGRAATAARAMTAAGEQKWGYLGPNCTTTALTVLKQAGIAVPVWSRSPLLLHWGLNAGSEITIVGGTAAALGGASGTRH